MPFPLLRSRPLSEPRDDSDVDEGDCLGVSSGDPDIELADDDASELRVAFLVSCTLRGVAVVAMVGGATDE